MSTILEALKKSEQERTLNKVPTLADMPAPQESTKWPHVLLVVIVLLLLTLIGFAIKFALFPPTLTNVSDSNAQPTAQVAAIDDKPIDDEEPIAESDVVVHVVSYSVSPEKRFIMIGSKLIREGEFVRAGLKVEEIRQDEVVLNLRGKQITRRP